MLAYLPELLKGLHTSLTLTAASLVVALLLALLFTVVLSLKTPLFSPLRPDSTAPEVEVRAGPSAASAKLTFT